eukprot:199249-Alexandrium_andersonii.AAC.1
MAKCLERILHTELPASAREIAALPFRQGGLALWCAARTAAGAYWASWPDCISQVHKRMPAVCEQLLTELGAGAASAA